MERDRFDPLVDREARLLRNGMAAALTASLEAGDPGLFREKGRALLARAAPVHRPYLQERLKRYERVWAALGRDHRGDPFAWSLLLWNHRLFFEVHDILEPLWRRSTGPRRQALQALIWAAGAYVHLEAGHRESARSLAAKAHAGLQASGEALPSSAWRDQLLAALADLDRPPPSLPLAGRQPD